MRLAIADPPYPPRRRATGPQPRASRWYGDKPLSVTDRAADVHANAADWDDPARHRALLLELVAEFDGWAIATTPDGIQAYGDLPIEARLMAWVRRSTQPGSHRIHSMWEAVILYPPLGRRSNRGGAGSVPDVLVVDATRNGFIGAKPVEWTRWILDALSYDPDADTVADLFPGSGMVTHAINVQRLPLFGS